MATPITMAVGSYTLTGVDIGIRWVLALVTGTYTLTGQAISFVLALRWNNATKNSSSLSNQSKSSSSWANPSKSSSTMTNLPKS
jgi:hypothetical protein